MKKDKVIVTYVEDPVFDAFAAYADKTGTKVSTLVRAMIVRDLISKGLLPQTTIERIATS